MKVAISKDELWPYYVLTDEIGIFDLEVEIPDAEYADMQQSIRKFFDVRARLGELYQQAVEKKDEPG